jgi:hypothetical protein
MVGVRGVLRIAPLLGALALGPASASVTYPDVGDANGDGSVDVGDVFYLVNTLFASGPAPLGSGDVNGDGVVNVADVFYLLNALFASGPAPVNGGWLSAWPVFAHDPAHSGRTQTAGQPLDAVHWHTPVDLDPQLTGGDLLTHYGSPLVSSAGTIVVTVKTGATDGFRVEGHDPSNGTKVWTEVLDYSLPPHDWIPVCQPTLTPGGTVVMPGAGGTVLVRASADAASSTVERRAFYGISLYDAAPSTYASNVKIDTPIVSDSAGTVYFGFVVFGATSANLSSGIARIDAAGNGSWTPVTTAANDVNMKQVPTNCAPALSKDGTVLYVAVRDGGPTSGTGYLVALNAATLAPLGRATLLDPVSQLHSTILDDGTPSPTVGPDGDVYYGVFATSTPNHLRGWLLHFDSTLATKRTPASFGWDTTAAVVPAASVPSYAGASSYLLFTKYNDYAEGGGSGVNKIAVLDPFVTQTDPVTGATVMKEVLTIAGPTPDPAFPGLPGAVREWCINAGAVDVAGRAVYANSEDGNLYRWDLTTNTLSQHIALTGGVGEAYTPTLVSRDGTVFAIQGGELYAVGTAPSP